MNKNIKKRRSNTLDLSITKKHNPYYIRKLSGENPLDTAEETSVNTSGIKKGFKGSESLASGIGAIAGAATSIIGAGVQNAQIADTTAIENQQDELSDTTFDANSTDSLLNQWNSINWMSDDWSAKDVRGLSGGEMAGNTIGAAASGAAAGAQVGGPWGAVIGGVVGLGSGLTGIFAGNRKARNKAKELNRNAQIANRDATKNFNLAVENQAADASRAALLANYAAEGGSIHIKEKNRGKFTESAKRAGMGVQEFARHVLTNKENYSPLMRRRANFARNTSSWKHDDGGGLIWDISKIVDLPKSQTAIIPFEIGIDPYKTKEDIHYDRVLEKLKEDSEKLDPRKISNIEALALRDSLLSSTSNYLTKERAYQYRTRTGDNNFYDNLNHGVYDITGEDPLLLGNGFDSENAEIFSSILKTRNLTPIQYASLMSHLNREANYNYKRGHKGDNYEDYGAYQFTDSNGKYKSTTLTDYKNWLKKNNKEDGPEAQTDFFLTEYLPKRKKAYEVWTNPNSTLEDMTSALLEYGFTPIKEVRNDEKMRKRLINLAESFLSTYAEGGKLNNTHGGDFSNGLIKIDEGGTHEANPFEGVPMGIAEDGIPNLVEEGEVIYNDYVYSNRLYPKEKDLMMIGLPKKYKNSTYAYIAEDMGKESEERPNDPISRRGLEDSLGKLAILQEEERHKRNLSGENRLMSQGGNKRKPLIKVGKVTPSKSVQEKIDNYTRSIMDPIYGEGFYNAFSAAADAVHNGETSMPEVKLKRNFPVKNNNDNGLPAYLRYAPAAVSAIGALSSAFAKPDYSNADILFDTAKNLSRPTVKPKLLATRLSYNPLDRNYLLNQLRNESAATRRAIMNSGINPASAVGTMLAADYNAQNNIGNALMQMEQYNRGLEERVKDFNRATDQYNSQMLMQADLANAQMLQNRDRLASSLIGSGVGIRENADAMLEQSRSNNMTLLGDNLGEIGRENFIFNQIKSNPDLYYDYINNNGIMGFKGKKGGRLYTSTKRRNR